MVGARYLIPFNDRWLLNLRGDVGGGDTESSWNAVATFGWRFGADLDNAVLVGWRYMQLEVENARPANRPHVARSDRGCVLRLLASQA